MDLLFLVCVLNRFRRGSALRLGFFHSLARFFGTLSADFSALLAFFVQHLFAAQEFDATILCYLAAVAAGSTDGQQMADHLIDITAPGGDEFTWQQLPDAIKALEDGKDIDYTGASGPIDMDVHGDPTAGVFDVYQYTADGLEAVGEVSAEKPNPATP